jgi:hypothetical protein
MTENGIPKQMVAYNLQGIRSRWRPRKWWVHGTWAAATRPLGLMFNVEVDKQYVTLQAIDCTKS